MWRYHQSSTEPHELLNAVQDQHSFLAFVKELPSLQRRLALFERDVRRSFEVSVILELRRNVPRALRKGPDKIGRDR